jgi:hypothetical protein
MAHGSHGSRGPATAAAAVPADGALIPAVLAQLLALLALVGWGVVAGIPVERRTVPLLIRHARGRAWRGALAAAGLQLAALAGLGLATLVAVLVGRLGGRPLVAVLEAVVLLAYLPVAMTALPTEFSGYGPVRRQMQRSGASRPVARAIAWSGGTVALVGTISTIAALFGLVFPV